MSNKPRCYLEVNLSMIRQNGLRIQKFIGNTKLMSVLKGDAYGLGIQRCALALNDVTDWFAVATAEEALAIREVGVEKPILVLGYVPSSQIKKWLGKKSR
ncbi:alanine racemase [Lacticaseibacillus paracasei subsp. paracasei CNCM I-4649]|nr:alanine racemase [Lacticaseibacillus paracasei subsp. paracasei CNCM I-4649]